MPVIWQSSQRPMYVRTVWVDGFRHAILNPDDPYLQKLTTKQKRPYSCISYNTRDQNSSRNRESRLSHHGDNLKGCLMKLNLVITSDKSYKTHIRPKTAHLEPDVEKLNLKELDQESEEEFIVRSKPQPLNEFESSRSRFNNTHTDMKSVKSSRTARTEAKENTELSDRVLQWLDLAGKVDLLAPENEAARMSQPRHSWPEIQKRNQLTKSKTTADLKTKTEPTKAETPKDGVLNSPYERNCIDRHDVYVPAPANTIENYARQSRHKSTPRNDNPNRQKENVKAKTRELRRNVQEARQKVVTERHAVEKQYAELVSKNILPDYGKSKKQVHIYMPEAAPKKPESFISQSS